MPVMRLPVCVCAVRVRAGVQGGVGVPVCVVWGGGKGGGVLWVNVAEV